MADADYLANLERKIEELRHTLNSFACIKKLANAETVRLSRELDYYIAAYYKNKKTGEKICSY